MRKLSIIGNLGQDAKVVTISEKNYLSFNVATTEKRNGEEKTVWISCLMGGADSKLPEYLKKGKRVYASGNVDLDTFTDKEGKTEAKIKMFIENLELL